MLQHRSLRGLSLLALALPVLPLAAQTGGPCSPQWQAESADGRVETLLTLPNGDLIAGGSFTSIGGIAANGIARRTSAGWQPFGSGMLPPAGWTVPATVTVVARMPNGDLVAGGYFGSAGGVAANHIARWNGTSWAPLGTGAGGVSGQFFPFQPQVAALAVLPNGDLAVGGHFLAAGGTAVQHLARWDGALWHDVGGGVQSSHLNPLPLVQAIAVMANGDVAIGGQFVFAGSGAGTILAANFARWNGTAWTAMSTGWDAGGMFGPVQQLSVLPNGDLVGCGTTRAPAPWHFPFVGRWTGSAWQSLAGNLTGTSLNDTGAHSLLVLPNGDLLTGGRNVTTSTGGVATTLERRHVGSVRDPDRHRVPGPHRSTRRPARRHDRRRRRVRGDRRHHRHQPGDARSDLRRRDDERRPGLRRFRRRADVDRNLAAVARRHAAHALRPGAHERARRRRHEPVAADRAAVARAADRRARLRRPRDRRHRRSAPSQRRLGHPRDPTAAAARVRRHRPLAVRRRARVRAERRGDRADGV
jgi:hypothetical protein